MIMYVLGASVPCLQTVSWMERPCSFFVSSEHLCWENGIGTFNLWFNHRQSLKKVSIGEAFDIPPRSRQDFFVGNGRDWLSRWGSITVTLAGRYILFFPFRIPNHPSTSLFRYPTPTTTLPNDIGQRRGPNRGRQVSQWNKMGNGQHTTPWTLGRVVPCGVRQDRVPSPDTQKLGNLGSTTWNPTSSEPRRAGFPASPRFLFYNSESLPQHDKTTRENL